MDYEPHHLPPTTPPPSQLPAPPSRDRRDSRDSRDGSSWREEEASLRHQLRIVKAELAACQTKLGIKQNPIAPFGSTSRKTSYSGDPSLSPGPFPRRKSSLGDLNSQLHRSPPTPEPRDRPATGSSPLSAYSSGGLPGPGSVALNRALVSNEGGVETLQSPPEHNDTSSSSTSSSLPKPNGTRLSSTAAAENPFFGSGQSSRERMSKSAASSQSGSGKVISGLQSDLLQARSALESTRGQLRLSQRAVEHLGRQTDDLKETKERLGHEIEGLNRSLARKERLQEEALTRARIAEASLAELQQTHRTAMTSHKGKVKELEEGKRKSDEARAKAESEYGALSRGMKSMSDGWRADLSWLKSDLAKSEARLASSSAAVTKLIDSRPSSHSDIDTALAGLTSTQRDFATIFSASAAVALKELEQATTQGRADRERAEHLSAEFARLRRLMAEHTAETAREGEGG